MRSTHSRKQTSKKGTKTEKRLFWYDQSKSESKTNSGYYMAFINIASSSARKVRRALNLRKRPSLSRFVLKTNIESWMRVPAGMSLRWTSTQV